MLSLISLNDPSGRAVLLRCANTLSYIHGLSGSYDTDRYPVWHYTSVSPFAFSRREVFSYWRKYVHEVLVNRLGGLSLPRKSVVRLTDRPDMTLDVYRGRKTTMQQQQKHTIPKLGNIIL